MLKNFPRNRYLSTSKSNIKLNTRICSSFMHITCQNSGEWRKLHNEELNDLHSTPNIVRVIKSKRMRWTGHVASMEERRGVYRILVRKTEGKEPLGRPRRRREDIIKMDTRK
jgi:hypothetical protein